MVSLTLADRDRDRSGTQCDGKTTRARTALSIVWRTCILRTLTMSCRLLLSIQARRSEFMSLSACTRLPERSALQTRPRTTIRTAGRLDASIMTDTRCRSVCRKSFEVCQLAQESPRSLTGLVNYATFDAGDGTVYGVYFDLMRYKSRGPCDVLLTVESAYRHDPGKRDTTDGRVSFNVIVGHALRGTRPKPPPARARKAKAPLVTVRLLSVRFRLPAAGADLFRGGRVPRRLLYS